MWSCRGTTPSSDYYIDVSPSPSKVFSSSTITITCYEDENLTIAIPSQVKWTRTHQGWSKKLPDISHAYVCKPTDIGSIIEAEIRARGSNNVERNSFTIKFGPIVLDPILRPTIEGILRNSIASFAVSIISNYRTKEYVLHITDVDLEIKDARTGNNMKSTYNSIEPEFIENITDPTCLTMMIPRENENDYERFFSVSSVDMEKKRNWSKVSCSEKKENSLVVRFSERESRDLFILARKAFVVKRETRLMSIIQNSLDTTISNNNSVDLLIQMSAVKALNEFLAKKKQLYKNQVDILQQQIQNIKNYYEGLLRQKTDRESRTDYLEKPKFDPMLSLLDSSNNSRQVGGHPGHAGTSRQMEEKRGKLQVIGEIEQIREIKINVSENVIYSQVIPFNESYSKKTSLDRSAYQKMFTKLQRHNTISQKQSSVDDQSILNSLHQMQQTLQFNTASNPFNAITDPTQTIMPSKFSQCRKAQSHQSITDRISKMNQEANREHLYQAWMEEAHKNLVLQSKINQLEKENAARSPLVTSNVSAQEFILRQNDQLTKLVKEKDGVIGLLVAENNNLKLLLDNSTVVRESYKERCEEMQKKRDRVLGSGELEEVQEFEERIGGYVREERRLMGESGRLGGMVKEALGQDLESAKVLYN